LGQNWVAVALWSGGWGQSGDLVPGGESGGHLVSVLGCGESVAAGPKWGDIPLNADKNRWAPPADRNRFIARSLCLVG